LWQHVCLLFNEYINESIRQSSLLLTMLLKRGSALIWRSPSNISKCSMNLLWSKRWHKQPVHLLHMIKSDHLPTWSELSDVDMASACKQFISKKWSGVLCWWRTWHSTQLWDTAQADLVDKLLMYTCWIWQAVKPEQEQPLQSNSSYQLMVMIKKVSRRTPTCCQRQYQTQISCICIAKQWSRSWTSGHDQI